MSSSPSSRKRTYLELSEEDGGTSHKFYEVTVEDCNVSVRYGRIGTGGQSSTKKYGDAAKATKDAEKKISAKKRKGYEESLIGVRQKRAISRRPNESKKSSSKPAPLLWQFQTHSPALGIHVDVEANCWIGNEAGRIFKLDSEGAVLKELKLPQGVKCLVADDDWLYAGCDDGNVYEVSHEIPHVAYAINENVNIYWLDIVDGALGVSDDKGGVHMFNHEDEEQWKKEAGGGSDAKDGWMIRCDANLGVFHGHSKGVTLYDFKDGTQKWNCKTSDVLFGWQEPTLVFAATIDKKVNVINKEDGNVQVVCKCDDAVYSCASAEDGKYIFAGDSSSSVYCFNGEGKRLWKLGTNCGSAFSMQYYKKRVYIVTTNGTMACLDASEQAIQDAIMGKQVPKTRTIKAPTATTAATTAETAMEAISENAASTGVVVFCVQEGSKVRVRVETSASSVSSKYHADWNVQFPKNRRKEGARFVVDELKESKSGGFYRVNGSIRRLI